MRYIKHNLGRCSIYRRPAIPTQAGQGDASWIIEPDAVHPSYINAITGWTASEDTEAQVSLHFRSLSDAIRYAETSGINYSVRSITTKGHVPKKSYQDNFIPKREFGSK